jgi:hypothetical protein
MTTQELLREVLQDPILRKKYGISQETLSAASFDSNSGHPIIETIKAIIQLKDSGTLDVNVYKNIKQTIFNITD